jgi:hypothetical protein
MSKDDAWKINHDLLFIVDLDWWSLHKGTGHQIFGVPFTTWACDEHGPQMLGVPFTTPCQCKVNELKNKFTRTMSDLCTYICVC